MPFFSGRFSISKPKLLIILAGYEVDRPVLLWRELEPSKVILAEGVEPTEDLADQPDEGASSAVLGGHAAETVTNVGQGRNQFPKPVLGRHPRRGQNVLFGDGSVSFRKKRCVGVADDDIFTLRNTLFYQGHEVPSCRTDTFLAP